MSKAILDDLLALDQPRGAAARTLRIADWRFVLEGLDEALASRLDQRWGGFLVPGSQGAPRLVVRVLRAGPHAWVEKATPGERYRMEARQEGGRPVVRSYHFALCPEGSPGFWRCALTDQDQEPFDRALENATRYLVARVALEDDGFALHGAGVLKHGRAYVFAGASRTGKTTAVSLSRPHPSLGDDFALVLRREEGWAAPAVPFDNQESAPTDPPRGLYPVAGIWRLLQALEPHVETLPRARAVASLMGCVAFPWALSDLGVTLLDRVRQFVEESRFEQLHFRNAPDFWPLIERYD